MLGGKILITTSFDSRQWLPVPDPGHTRGRISDVRYIYLWWCCNAADPGHNLQNSLFVSNSKPTARGMEIEMLSISTKWDNTLTILPPQCSVLDTFNYLHLHRARISIRTNYCIALDRWGSLIVISRTEECEGSGQPRTSHFRFCGGIQPRIGKALMRN